MIEVLATMPEELQQEVRNVLSLPDLFRDRQPRQTIEVYTEYHDELPGLKPDEFDILHKANRWFLDQLPRAEDNLDHQEIPEGVLLYLSGVTVDKRFTNIHKDQHSAFTKFVCPLTSNPDTESGTHFFFGNTKGIEGMSVDTVINDMDSYPGIRMEQAPTGSIVKIPAGVLHAASIPPQGERRVAFTYDIV